MFMPDPYPPFIGVGAVPAAAAGSLKDFCACSGVACSLVAGIGVPTCTPGSSVACSLVAGIGAPTCTAGVAGGSISLFASAVGEIGVGSSSGSLASLALLKSFMDMLSGNAPFTLALFASA